MRPDTTQPELFDRLAGIGRDHAAGPGEPKLLYDRHGVLVVRIGEIVVKAHQPDRAETDGSLERRVRIAQDLPELFLAPLAPPLHVAGRTVTVTPYGEPARPDALPWVESARLLARLHRSPVPDGAPPLGRPERVARQVSRLPGGPAADVVRRAFATLPPAAEFPHPGRLLHGDWHMGQMVRNGDGWRFIDIEDLGRGDPVWDLARPAALFTAGVLHPDDWADFLTAYRAAGGPAVPAFGTPWTVLDVPARTLVIQIAATCVISARDADRPLDPAEQAVIDTCGRISRAGDPA
ncbi:phosphotransferase family protein [Actinomadura hibisca]|uniref:phosphotransferase family protein n=1 Tax=Actinomadura hibisca TaxID=68565 RepID=UPI000830864C|nr:phosphotransferase [Actinomadura hibisca]